MLFYIVSICQLSGDEYVDDDNILEEILDQEQRIRNQRRNNIANPAPNANNIRLLIENYLQDG